jgi:orotidine-5'-phosphate decarboxylase
MNSYTIFDNGAKTLDRYTIISRETGYVFGCSEKPDEPGGIGKCCGSCADMRIVMPGAGWRQKTPAKRVINAAVDNYINDARLDPNWIGREVAFNNLPVAVRKYILHLDSSDSMGESSKVNVVHMSTVPESLSSVSSMH